MAAIVTKTLSTAATVSSSWLWNGVLKWWVRPKLVFMVYPGSRKYIDKMMFRWVYEHVPMPNIVPIGLIHRPGMVGVYAATSDLLMEVDGPRLKEVTAKIPKAFPFARSVSLAGSWPSMLQKAGGSASSPPLVDATLGTVYAMDKVCMAMIEERGVAPSEAELCVLGGGGFVGNVLLPKIQDRYKGITAIDPCYASADQEGGIVRSNDPSLAAEADAVLVLTPRGDDAAPYADYAAAGQVWGDDTFPDMTPPTQKRFVDAGAKLFKTSMVDRDLRFVPPLPTFGKSNVPGCLISAIVNEKKPGISDLDEFYTIADSVGFQAMLFPHRKDLPE